MTTSADHLIRAERMGRVHLVVAPLLVVLAPVMSWGASGLAGHLLPTILLLIGWGTCAVECVLGLRTRLRYSWGGIIASVLLGLLALRAESAPDPTRAWMLVAGWAWVWLWAWYLLQVVAALRSTLVAALVASLGLQIALALMQGAVVIPALIAAVEAGDRAVQPLIAEVGTRAGLLERLRNGGVWGSFTIANSLAAWILILAAPLALAAWRLRPQAAAAEERVPVRALALLWILLATALGALAAAGARGPLLALVVAASVAWALRGRRAWRGALVAAALVVLGLALAWLMPASLEVRLGYWRAAWHTALEAPVTGSGPGAFADLGRQYLAVEDEFSRQPHNAVLVAWIGGGLVAALALIALLGRWLGAARPAQLAPDQEPSATAPPGLALAVIAVAPLAAAVCGALDAHLQWWPLGSQIGGRLLWGLALALLAGALAHHARAWPLPGPAAWGFGLSVFALASLIDFHWFQPGLLATVAVVAVLALRPGQGRSFAHARGLRLVAVAVLLLGLLGHILTARALSQRADFDRARDALRAAIAAGARPDGPSLIALEARLPSWPHDPDRHQQLYLSIPDHAQRAVALEHFVSRHPERDAAWSALARSHAAAGDLRAATRAAQGAVAAYPSRLAHRQLLADLAERLAASGQDPGALDPQAIAAAQRTWLEQHRAVASHSHWAPQPRPEQRSTPPSLDAP